MNDNPDANLNQENNENNNPQENPDNDLSFFRRITSKDVLSISSDLFPSLVFVSSK